MSRLRLQGEVHVRPQVVDPQLLRPGLLLGRLGVEEQHVGLSRPGRRKCRSAAAAACGRRTACSRLRRTVSPAPPSNSTLSGTTIAQRPLILSNVLDVLQEVELLVLCRGPEVLPFVGGVFFFQVAFLVDDGDAALLAERRIGQHHAEPLARVTRETVSPRLHRARIGVDAVQVQVHDAQPGGVGDQFPALHERRPQVLLLILVEFLAVVADDVVVGGQQESARAAGRIADGVVRLRPHHVDDGLDQFAGREVLPRTLGGLGGTLGQQPFVDVALDVGLHRRPLLGVDQVHDQPLERGRVLDLLPSLLEDLAQHPRLLAEFFEDVPVVDFQLVAVPLEQALPAELRRHDRLAVVRRLRLLVGHLEEQQESDLLRVGHVRQAIVPQNVGEVPGFVDDLLGGVGHLIVCEWDQDKIGLVIVFDRFLNNILRKMRFDLVNAMSQFS